MSSALAARMHALTRDELADLAELAARVCAASTGAALPTSAHAEEHDLVELTARMCHASADALSLVNAALSEHVPPWAVEDVLLSPDLSRASLRRARARGRRRRRRLLDLAAVLDRHGRAAAWAPAGGAWAAAAGL